MKNLKEIILESKFGYTWENAFIYAITSLINKSGDKEAKEIINNWFNDEEAAHNLYTFLYRLGYKPKSKEVDDLYNILKEISTYKKFILK